MERAKILTAVLLAVVALGFLVTSVRTSMVADSGGPGLALLPAAKVAPAPDWTVPDARTGQNVNLRAQARLRPVVFSFWATWCGPCKEELPHLQHVFERYQSRVAFYGISSDDTPAAITAFARRNRLTLPLLADVRHQAAARYGVQSIPLLVVVDTQGNIRAAANGYDPREDLEASLPKLLDTLLAQDAEGKKPSPVAFVSPSPSATYAKGTRYHETSSARRSPACAARARCRSACVSHCTRASPAS